MGANGRHLRTNHARLPGAEWHWDAPESPVSVQERMQRLELSLQGRKPHQPVGLGRVHVTGPRVGRRMEPVCLDGDEAGLVCGTTRRPNPAGDPQVPGGRSTPAAHPLNRCQAHRDAAVGLDPIAGLARDQARRYNLAIVAGSDNPAVYSAAGGSRFVGEARGLSVRDLELADQPLERGLPVREDPPMLRLLATRPHTHRRDRDLADVQSRVCPVLGARPAPRRFWP